MDTARLNRTLNRRRDHAKRFIACTCLLASANLLFIVGLRPPAIFFAVIGAAGCALFAAAWIIEPKRIGLRVAKRALELGTLLPLGEALRIVERNDTIVIPWSSIRRLTAFKRDILFWDNICLLIEQEDGKLAQIEEEMIGWEQVMDALPKQLPGIQPHDQWWPAVAFPAFETNATVIYERSTPL